MGSFPADLCSFQDACFLLFLVVALAVLCLSQVEASPAKRGVGHCNTKVSNCSRCYADNDKLCEKCKAGVAPIDGGKKCKYIKEKVPKKDRQCCCDKYGNCTKNGDEITARIETYINGEPCPYRNEEEC